METCGIHGNTWASFCNMTLQFSFLKCFNIIFIKRLNFCLHATAISNYVINTFYHNQHIFNSSFTADSILQKNLPNWSP